MACAALHADEPSVKISLGIRDTKLLTITNVAYPLAFRIENEGKTAIAKGQIPGLFLKNLSENPMKGSQYPNPNPQRGIFART